MSTLANGDAVDKLTVAQLKNALRERKLPLGGTKAVLRERLVSALSVVTGDTPSTPHKEKTPSVTESEPSLMDRTAALFSASVAEVIRRPEYWKLYTISYGNEESLPHHILLGLCVEVSDLSFSDLTASSPLVETLYRTELMWQLRAAVRTHELGVVAKPPSVTWETYASVIKSAAYVGFTEDYNAVHKLAWKTFTSVPSIDEEVREFEIDSDARWYPVTLLGELSSGKYVSFSNFREAVRDVSLKETYSLRSLRSISIFDVVLDDILTQEKMNELEAVDVPLRNVG